MVRKHVLCSHVVHSILVIMLFPQSALCEAGPEIYDTVCSCVYKITMARYHCIYTFKESTWTNYPCSDEFVKRAEQYCDSAPNNLLFSDMTLLYRKDLPTLPRRCQIKISIVVNPFCIEDLLQCVKPETVAPFECVCYLPLILPLLGLLIVFRPTYTRKGGRASMQIEVAYF